MVKCFDDVMIKEKGENEIWQAKKHAVFIDLADRFKFCTERRKISFHYEVIRRIKWSGEWPSFHNYSLRVNDRSSILDRFLSGETRQLRWCFNVPVTCHLGGPFSIVSSRKKTAITCHVIQKFPFYTGHWLKAVKFYVITKIHHVYVNSHDSLQLLCKLGFGWYLNMLVNQFLV